MLSVCRLFQLVQYKKPANLTAKQGPNPTAMPLASQVLPPHRQYLKPASRSLLQKKTTSIITSEASSHES
jgi:hypothetical protein